MKPVCTTAWCSTFLSSSLQTALPFSTCSAGCWMRLFHYCLPPLQRWNNSRKREMSTLCVYQTSAGGYAVGYTSAVKYCKMLSMFLCLHVLMSRCVSVCICKCVCLTCLWISSKTKRNDSSFWSSKSSWTSTDKHTHQEENTEKHSLNRHNSKVQIPTNSFYQSNIYGLKL